MKKKVEKYLVLQSAFEDFVGVDDFFETAGELNGDFLNISSEKIDQIKNKNNSHFYQKDKL